MNSSFLLLFTIIGNCISKIDILFSSLWETLSWTLCLHIRTSTQDLRLDLIVEPTAMASFGRELQCSQRITSIRLTFQAAVLTELSISLNYRLCFSLVLFVLFESTFVHRFGHWIFLLNVCFISRSQVVSFVWLSCIKCTSLLNFLLLFTVFIFISLRISNDKRWLKVLLVQLTVSGNWSC